MKKGPDLQKDGYFGLESGGSTSTHELVSPRHYGEEMYEGRFNTGQRIGLALDVLMRSTDGDDLWHRAETTTGTIMDPVSDMAAGVVRILPDESIPSGTPYAMAGPMLVTDRQPRQFSVIDHKSRKLGKSVLVRYVLLPEQSSDS